MKPKPLKQGDLVLVAAPAGPFNRAAFLRGVHALDRSGFKTKYRPDIFVKKRYLAGPDQRRLKELTEALANPEAKALLFARGGYGTMRLLPELARAKVAPKVLIGLSDLTVLLLFLWQQHRLPSIYGPLVATHLIHPANARRVRLALTDPNYFHHQPLKARQVLIKAPGKEAPVVGGCLSLLTATLGTPYECQTSGSILFLEDTHEEPYAVDRLLTQLKHAGKFDRIRGLVLGTFWRRGVYFPTAIREVFQDHVAGWRVPVLWGVRFGHCPDPLLIPLGGQGRIQGNQLLITRGIFA